MKKLRLFLIPLLIAALLSAELHAYAALSEAGLLAAGTAEPAFEEAGSSPEEVPSAEATDDPDSDDFTSRAIASQNQDRVPEQAVLSQIPTLVPAARRPYTVMVYMIGSDLESKYGNATLDIAEMEASGLNPEKANLLLYTGGCRSWKSEIPSSKNCILDMSLPAEKRIVASTETSADMGSPETLSSFINFCTTNYPAEHYMLILWDHGAGPLRGYGNDELFGGDSLLLSEMKEAIQATIFGKGKKLDLVGFDACLMGCYENMAMWRSFAKYYVASEELEPGNGWDYHFLNVFNTETDPRAIAEAITSSFSAFYSARTTETYRPQITLSCTDLSKVPQVTTALRKLFSRMEKGVNTGDYPALSRIRSSALSFGRVQTTSGSFSFDLVDLTDLTTKLQTLYPAEAAALRSCLKDFLVCNTSTIENAGGISLFYPCENKGQFEKMASLYKTINISASYSRFLDSISSEWMSAKSRNWNLGSLSLVNGELQLQLTEDQLEHMDTVYYTVLSSNGGSYVPMMDKISLTPDRKGIVHIPADPKVFYLDPGGSDVTVWNVSQTGSSRSRIYYQTNHMMLYTDANPLGHMYGYDSMSVYVNFSTDLRGGNLKVGSISATAATFDTMGKASVELQDWEAASHVEECRIPTRDRQGRLLPASQWSTNSVSTFYVTPYKNDFTFGLAPASTLSDNCVCQVVLEDVNGEAYATELYHIQSQDYRPVTLEMPDGTWDFLVYSDHAALVDFTGSSTRVTIPPAVEGVPVTEIFSGAFGEYTVGDRYGSCPIESVILPKTLKVLHGSAFYHCTKLRSVRLPEGLTTIGDMAFSGCQSLKEIAIPSTVTSIGNLAFDSCYELDRVALPPYLTTLGKSLFMDCPKLQSITGAAKSGYRLIRGALYSEDGSVLIACPHRKGDTVRVADGTKEIGSGAFTNAPLSKIVLPKSLRRIGSLAFFHCKNLAMPALPDGLTFIGAMAFGTTYRGLDITALSEEPVEIRLGSALQKIGPEAFTGIGSRYFTVSEDNSVFAAVDGSLTTGAKDQLIALAADPSFAFTVPEGILSFDWDELDPLRPYDFPYLDAPAIHFIFPDSVTAVQGSGSYYSSGSLTVHAAPGSAAQLWASQNNCRYSSDPEWNWEIKAFPTAEGTLYARLAGDHAVILFYEGKDDTLIIPDTLEGLPVTVLGSGAYPIMMPPYYSSYSYTELGFEPDPEASRPTGIVLPDTVTTLAAHCLDSLYCLERAELPESITVIEDNALGRMANGNWVLPHGLTHVGSGFVNGYEGPFPITPALKYISPSAFQYCTGMAGFVQEGENETWSVRDGVLYSADGKTLLSCMNASLTDGHFSVPEGTEIIGENAFQSAKKLQTVEFPAGLRRIARSAFESAYYLTELHFTDNETPLSVESYAFAYCSALTDINLPASTRGIGSHAFASCRSLSRAVLPENLVTLDEYAFGYCSGLQEMVFNDKLTYIGDYAFSGCTRLAKVTLPDSLVTLGSSVFPDKLDLPAEEIVPFTMHIGPNVRSIGRNAFGALPIEAFDVDIENRFFAVPGPGDGTPGLLLSGNGSSLICCPAAMIGRIRVPGSVSMILPYAFYNSGMTDVFLPDTVLDISSIAFRQDYEDLTDESTGKSTRTYYYSFTIHCSHGSIAEQYAIRRQIPYVLERQ